MLAIVTPALFRTSETFITRHIREIAPGRTVVVCFEGASADRLSCPVLSVHPPNRRSLRWLVRKSLGGYNLLTSGNTSPLNKSEVGRLAGFLRTNNVECALAEYGTTACAVRHACKVAGVDLFAHFHGHDASAGVTKWRSRHAYRRLARHTAGIICPSEFLAGKLVAIGLPRARMHVIPYGVDTDEFRPGHEKDASLVLAVGRFVPKKAPHRTIEAFAKATEKHKHTRLEMIGDGPLLGQCKKLVVRMQLEGQVVFHGAQDHSFVKAKMKRASIFVQHSVTAEDGDTEGLGISLLEAMACAVPVVATRHNGFVETVMHGNTGFLVNEHDVAAMADRITRLIDDRAVRESMGKAGRQRVIEHFSARKQIQQLRQLLRVELDDDNDGGVSANGD